MSAAADRVLDVAPARSTDSGGDRPVELLTVDDLIELARRLLGDPPPIRDAGLLASAAARPGATAFGEDAYPMCGKAAALLHSIVTNPRWSTATKRLGWLATAVFLMVNDVPADRADNDDVYDLVVAVAGPGRHREVGDIAARLRAVVDGR